MKNAATWELVVSEDDRRTHRLRVDGGWLYRVTHENGVALVFVPRPPIDTGTETG